MLTAKDTLYLTNSNLKFKPVLKDRFFHNQFEYSVTFHLREAHGLRRLNHEDIDTMLDWISGRSSYYSTFSMQHEARSKSITPEVRANLHTAVDFFTTVSVPHKLAVTTHRGTVFFNDLDMVDQLSNLPGVAITDARQAQIDRPANTVLLNNPKHTHRTYFKFFKITAEQKRNLAQFFQNQTEIRLSPGLKEWFNTPYSRLQDYHFIDHTGTGALLMLSLVVPSAIRKTLQIQAR